MRPTAQPSRHGHTLPQLPLSLGTLQLQPLHRILQPFLLLHEPSQLRRLRRRAGALARARARTRAGNSPRGTPAPLPGLIRANPAFLQIAFRLQALLAAREPLDVVGGLGQQVGDAGGDFVEEGLLGFAEGGLWKEFKVLFMARGLVWVIG
jgi:hypothetical protein